MTTTALTAPAACCSVASGGLISLTADPLTHTGDASGRVSFAKGGSRRLLGRHQHAAIDAVHICMRAEIVRVGAGDQGDGILIDGNLGSVERANGDHAGLSSNAGMESDVALRLLQGQSVRSGR